MQDRFNGSRCFSVDCLAIPITRFSHDLYSGLVFSATLFLMLSFWRWAPSVVAKNSILDVILVPSDYIYYVDDGGSGLGGWKVHDVFHNYEQIGAEASIVFPVIIENVTNEYTFRFQVKDVFKK